MRSSLFILAIVLSQFSQAQSLEFVELGGDPALCRTASYQSGNGVIYAFAFGGTAPLTYQWKDLQTGDSTSNTTWGGLNPGCYEITVTDAVDDQLVDTVCIDSISPNADIYFNSSEFELDCGYYHGFMPVDVSIFKVENYAIASPDPQPRYWKYSINGEWTEDLEIAQIEPIEYSFPSIGEYEICLRETNKNGCADTACITFQIHPERDVNIDRVFVIVDPFSNIVNVYNQELFERRIRFITFEGQVLEELELTCPHHQLEFNAASALYLFQVFDENDEIIQTGKFGF